MAKKVTKEGGGAHELLLHSGRRPSFHALWHLSVLGVVENLTDKPRSDVWRKVHENLQGNSPRNRVTVAIIDTMPAYTHPCLEGQIDFDNGRDFTKYFGETDTNLPDPTENPSHYAFGAHGTAVAGLIAARPRSGIELYVPPDVTPEKAATARAGKGEAPEHGKEIHLPYCGINPFAKIIPIVVSAAPEPAMLVAALKHAATLEPRPDVVVIADSWDRHLDKPALKDCPLAEKDRTKKASPTNPDAYNAFSDGSQKEARLRSTEEAWAEVEQCVLALCDKCFVFCAAGNKPRNTLVFPASLSKPDSGPWVVGACDLMGRDLTYTPPSDYIRNKLEARLISTLSSEQSRWDRITQKLDPYAKIDKELGIPDWLFEQGFQDTDIVTIDVPGPAGYNPSPYDYFPPHDGPHLEFASLFCRFSGTSAATAIAAGLVSLAIALNRSQAQHKSGPYKGPNGPELFGLTQAEELVGRGRP